MLRWFADIGCERSAIAKLVYPARDNIGIENLCECFTTTEGETDTDAENSPDEKSGEGLVESYRQVAKDGSIGNHAVDIHENE